MGVPTQLCMRRSRRIWLCRLARDQTFTRPNLNELRPATVRTAPPHRGDAARRVLHFSTMAKKNRAALAQLDEALHAVGDCDQAVWTLKKSIGECRSRLGGGSFASTAAEARQIARALAMCAKSIDAAVAAAVAESVAAAEKAPGGATPVAWGAGKGRKEFGGAGSNVRRCGGVHARGANAAGVRAAGHGQPRGGAARRRRARDRHRPPRPPTQADHLRKQQQQSQAARRGAPQAGTLPVPATRPRRGRARGGHRSVRAAPTGDAGEARDGDARRGSRRSRRMRSQIRRRLRRRSVYFCFHMGNRTDDMLFLQEKFAQSTAPPTHAEPCRVLDETHDSTAVSNGSGTAVVASKEGLVRLATASARMSRVVVNLIPTSSVSFFLFPYGQFY